MKPVEETWEEKKNKKRRRKKNKFESTASSEESSLLASASENEIAVSHILLELVNRFPIEKRLPKLAWGCTKRRSCLGEAPSNSCEPSSKSPSIQKTCQEVEAKLGKVTEEVEGSPAAAAASSPATPLSFSPSESDEKSKHYSKKASKKRSRKEYNDLIERLTHHGNSLRMEIETARNHHKNLKIHNSELKRMKQEEMLKTWRRKDTDQMEVSRFVNLGIDLTQHYQIKALSPRQPFVADPTADDLNRSIGPIITNNPELCLSNSGRESVKLVGQVRIPDLNLSAEEAFGVDESQPLDEGRALPDKRARFAEARRLRRGIIKIKSMRRACGIKLPRTGY